MNRSTRLLTAALIAIIAAIPVARAIPVIDVYVDAAPNASGSPNYAPWWAAAQPSVISGTFVNMEHSTNPLNAGTLMFDIHDAFVYSFGDLGKRVQFIYWLPGETKANLVADNFQMGIDLVWDGVTYSDWAYGTDWVTPVSLWDYDGGVIGTAGIGIWGAYGVNTQAALDADIAAYQPYTDAFSFRVKSDTIAPTTLLTVTQRVPDGASTLVLLGTALAALVAFRRRFAGAA